MVDAEEITIILVVVTLADIKPQLFPVLGGQRAGISTAQSQDLVKNASFDIEGAQPTGWSQIDHTNGWTNGNGGTVDDEFTLTINALPTLANPSRMFIILCLGNFSGHSRSSFIL